MITAPEERVQNKLESNPGSTVISVAVTGCLYVPEVDVQGTLKSGSWWLPNPSKSAISSMELICVVHNQGKQHLYNTVTLLLKYPTLMRKTSFPKD